MLCAASEGGIGAANAATTSSVHARTLAWLRTGVARFNEEVMLITLSSAPWGRRTAPEPVVLPRDWRRGLLRFDI